MVNLIDAAVQQLSGDPSMTNSPSALDPTLASQLREAATQLIGRLSDRAAYAAPEEFEEIRAVIRGLRLFCSLPPNAA
jgi:hypothetical protein